MDEVDANALELPEVFAPTAQSSLSSAKVFLIRSVEALLTNGRWAQAKQIIDSLAALDTVLQDKSIVPMSAHDKRFSHKEIEAIIQGRKIDAIKLVRERTGSGLKEAKDLVESFTVPTQNSVGKLGY